MHSVRPILNAASRAEGTCGFPLIFLSQVYLMELLDAGYGSPATEQSGRARRLARMRKARFDLLGEYLADVYLERRLLAAEAPCLRRLVRRTRLRKRERVAGGRPRGV
jgi:hypothetical protein